MLTHRAYPTTRITAENWAMGATDSDSILGILGTSLINIESVDVIIVAYSDNDWEISFTVGTAHITAAFEELIRLLLSLPGEPVIIIYEMYVLDAPSTHVFAPHGVVANHYGLPILSYDAAALPYDKLAELPAPAPGISADGTWSQFIFRERHPPWPYHQLISDYFTYVWTRIAVKACSESASGGAGADAATLHSVPRLHLQDPIAEFIELRAQLFEYCLNPLTLIQGEENVSSIAFVTTLNRIYQPATILNSTVARTFSGSDGLFVSNGSGSTIKYRHNWTNEKLLWRYGEDYPGNQKYGWCIDNPMGGRISFTVKLARYVKPIISFGFLESYEHMGTVAVFLDNQTQPIAKYDALNTVRRISRTKSVTLCVDKLVALQDEGITRPALQGQLSSGNTMTSSFSHDRFRKVDKFTMRKIHFELIPLAHGGARKKNKFKIVFLKTC